MGIIRFTKRAIKPFIDVPRWVGYKQLAESGHLIKESFKQLFIPAQPTHHETFEEAMARLGLSETDIAQRHQEFGRLRLIFLLIAAGIFSYGIYLAFQGSVKGCLVAFALTLVPLAQAFRYHFWLFQLHQRKLGCSFRELVNFYLTGNKK